MGGDDTSSEETVVRERNDVIKQALIPTLVNIIRHARMAEHGTGIDELLDLINKDKLLDPFLKWLGWFTDKILEKDAEETSDKSDESEEDIDEEEDQTDLAEEEEGLSEEEIVREEKEDGKDLTEEESLEEVTEVAVAWPGDPKGYNGPEIPKGDDMPAALPIEDEVSQNTQWA